MLRSTIGNCNLRVAGKQRPGHAYRPKGRRRPAAKYADREELVSLERDTPCRTRSCGRWPDLGTEMPGPA